MGSTKSDDFSDLLNEFSQYKTGEVVTPVSEEVADDAGSSEETTETNQENIKVDTVTIETDNNNTKEGVVSEASDEKTEKNEFIDGLLEDTEKIKELYLSNHEKTKELERYSGVDDKLNAIEDLGLEDIALLKAVKSGNLDAFAKLLQDSNIDAVDLVAYEEPEGGIDLSGITEKKTVEPKINSEDLLDRMSAQATVSGSDTDKVRAVLGSFDEKSLMDIASDPDNSRKVLSSIDDVEKAIELYKSDLKYDFSNRLGKMDSFEQLQYGLKKMEEASSVNIPQEKGVKEDVVDRTIDETLNTINEQQKQFPDKGSTNSQETTDSFDALYKEYRATVGL